MVKMYVKDKQRQASKMRSGDHELWLPISRFHYCGAYAEHLLGGCFCGTPPPFRGHQIKKTCSYRYISCIHIVYICIYIYNIYICNMHFISFHLISLSKRLSLWVLGQALLVLPISARSPSGDDQPLSAGRERGIAAHKQYGPSLRRPLISC